MKKALLVGINAYRGGISGRRPRPLSGCINDVADMHDLLSAKFHFKPSAMRVLRDADATMLSIRKGLDWLVNGLCEGDCAVFHFSGHGFGLPTEDRNDEPDGIDEVILPIDFEFDGRTAKNAILDNEFQTLFEQVPRGVNFIWIFDSCCSGGLGEERARGAGETKSHGKARYFAPPPDVASRISAVRAKGFQPLGLRGSVAGLNNVVLLTACRNDQVAGDGAFNGRPNGALTYFFLRTLREDFRQPLDTLMIKLTKALHAEGYTYQDPELHGSRRLRRLSFLEPLKVST